MPVQPLEIVLILVAAAAVVFGPRVVRDLLGKTPMLTPPDLKAMLDRDEDLLVLDVRNRDEFTGNLGHIAGAVNVPVGEVAGRMQSLGEALGGHMDTPVVTVCRTDNRAYMAARMLKQHGFRQVSVLRGGMSAWNRQGLPVSRHL